MKRWLLLFAIALLASSPGLASAKPAVPSWRDTHPWTTNTGTVEIGQTHIAVELADTPALQARGLGYRDELAPDTGMLFVFSDRSKQTFWMRGMRFCLDIIWIDGSVVTGAAEKVCPEPGVEVADLQRYSSEGPVDMVLEVPAGWMEINGVGVGTVLRITLPSPSQT